MLFRLADLGKRQRRIVIFGRKLDRRPKWIECGMPASRGESQHVSAPLYRALRCSIVMPSTLHEISRQAVARYLGIAFARKCEPPLFAARVDRQENIVEPPAQRVSLHLQTNCPPYADAGERAAFQFLNQQPSRDPVLEIEARAGRAPTRRRIERLFVTFRGSGGAFGHSFA